MHVFLSTGSSYQEAAERLSLHKNTVFYRVRKAQEVRGRKVAEDRFVVELALLACHWLGPAVPRLRSKPSSGQALDGGDGRLGPVTRLETRGHASQPRGGAHPNVT